MEDWNITKSTMTLRDWFAGQALAGLAGAAGEHRPTSYTQAAEWAYAQADAMMAERETKPADGEAIEE